MFAETVKAVVKRVKVVFAEHKTEMLIAVGIGVVVGAVLF